MGYNFVFYKVKSDYWLIPFSELKDRNDVLIIKSDVENKSKLIRLLYRIHNHPYTKKMIRLPFRKIWYPSHLERFFEDENTICFVFMGGEYYEYVKYCKKKYPNARFVAYLGDIVSACKDDLDLVTKQRDLFDLIITFDQGDAVRYNLLYHRGFYSPIDLGNNKIINDVFFVGKAKDRYEKIIAVYERLSKAGFNCDFHIVEVPEHKQKYKDKIKYNDYMSYGDVLKGVMSSKCILEIVQKGSCGLTMRVKEAIMYDKKLITDNMSILDHPFYDSRKIHCFSKVKDLNCQFLVEGENNISYSREIKESLLPSNFLDFICKNLDSLNL